VERDDNDGQTSEITRQPLVGVPMAPRGAVLSSNGHWPSFVPVWSIGSNVYVPDEPLGHGSAH
jgi:hypothetical protein